MQTTPQPPPTCSRKFEWYCYFAWIYFEKFSFSTRKERNCVRILIFGDIIYGKLNFEFFFCPPPQGILGGGKKFLGGGHLPPPRHPNDVPDCSMFYFLCSIQFDLYLFMQAWMLKVLFHRNRFPFSSKLKNLMEYYRSDSFTLNLEPNRIPFS